MFNRISAAVILCIVGFTASQSNAFAGRVMTTPAAEVLKAGEYRLFSSSLKELESSDNTRSTYRLDLGLTDKSEVSVIVTDPEDKPKTTQINVQQSVSKASETRPALSIGLWDAGHIDEFNGDKTGASLFLVAGKSLKQGADRPPIKLNLGIGTNRLDGVFGSVVIPLNPKLGFQAEYSPKNSRLPEAGAINTGIYYFPTPKTRIRIASVGGNPMIDFFVLGSVQ